jgi:hypothetical protein
MFDQGTVEKKRMTAEYHCIASHRSAFPIQPRSPALQRFKRGLVEGVTAGLESGDPVPSPRKLSIRLAMLMRPNEIGAEVVDRSRQIPRQSSRHTSAVLVPAIPRRL